MSELEFDPSVLTVHLMFLSDDTNILFPDFKIPQIYFYFVMKLSRVTWQMSFGFQPCFKE